LTTKLNIAIIGCGNIAQRHAAEAVKYAHLVAVCDIVPEKARSLANKYSCNAYFDLDKMLEQEPNIDLVSICTPNWLHAPLSIYCMERGFHVLCEKPMAIKVADAHTMAEVAREKDRKLFIVKQNRYNPPVEFVKNLINKNKLGRILSFQVNGFWNRPDAYYTDWRGKKNTDGGTLYTQFSHFVDLILWLCGDVKDVTYLAGNQMHPSSIEFEDTGCISFKMQSGAIGSFNYTVNSFKKNMEGSFTIFAEKGTIKIGGQYLNELEYFQVEGIEKPELPIGNGANQYGFYQGSMSNHDKIYENVVKALQDNTHPFLEGAEAIQTIEVIEKIYRSLSN
jgi:UDP-N-acetyl-2-amino-2-deoxyglucuronate dehydrogenase